MARSSHAGWELAAGPGFTPRDVPEVASGYWWDAANTTGFGTTGFKVLEGNGHTTFDLIQATVASQPTQLTEAGGQQFRMRKQADPNPSRLVNAGAVSAGWTGATYVGMWIRLPDASGDITAGGSLFLHTGGAGARRWTSGMSTTTSDRFSSSFSIDGTATSVVRWASPFVGGGWVWCEHAFDPLHVLGGTVTADAPTFLSNFVGPQTQLLGTSNVTSIFDASAQVFMACNSAVSSNTDTVDWSFCVYANGIPSLANRKRLANFRNPSGVLL